MNIATPERQMDELDPFDDNFSQFFRSQFIKIPELDMSLAQPANKNVPTTEYDFTQCDGLSQFSFESQLDNTIIAGQRCITNDELANEDDDVQTKRNEDQQNTEFGCDQNDNQQMPEDGENEENAVESENDVQCSQLFLKELSSIQTNISSIVNETINASKFNMEDFLDPNDQYEVFKSTVTHSQYAHRKQSYEPISAAHATTVAATPKIFVKATNKSTLSSQSNLNTEMMDDQLLAQMVYTTQMLVNNTELLEDQMLAQYDENDLLNISDGVSLNDCIDPDSSALAHLLSDEDEKENIENVEIVSKNANKSEQREQQVPSNVNHDLVRNIRQTESTNHHSPVTASKFYSMGPFFGLPTQVKKLIKTFKNIDDLYGI